MPQLLPVEQIANSEVRAFSEEAASFLDNQPWCDSILSADLGWAVAGILGIFLFRITPKRPEIDERLWVVVGDLPSAYLVYADNATWRDALSAYVVEMERWVDAIQTGAPVEGLIPVQAEPTQEHAEMLSSRLNFIRENILADDDDSPGDT